MNPHLLCERAIDLLLDGQLQESEQLFLQLVEVEGVNFTARHLLGVIRMQQGRNEEALEWIGAALQVNPQSPAALSNYGNALMALGQAEPALASYDKALALDPDFAEALYNRGTILADLKRPEEALASYDKALALEPDHVQALEGRGNILSDLGRADEALASYDRALALRPDFIAAHYSRGNLLSQLKRLDEALAGYDKALALRPDFIEAGYRRGSVLCELNRVAEGLAVYRHFAELALAPDAGGLEEPAYKVRHDAEQREYLGIDAARSLPFHLAGGERLATRAVNPDDGRNIGEQWRTSRPQLVVIDDLLSPEALDGLRRFCWGSTIWRKIYENGYLGATPESGFACPLLAQIADEMRLAYPEIFRAHPLRYLWGFKYDSSLSGINLHADFAAVNVNFWITPDEANLDPDSGGLVVWDAPAPLDWDFEKYNKDVTAARDFLARSGAKKITVPYRANRAVIFDSDLFHETDQIRFKDGYQNRRINVTLLYGDRGAGDI